MTPATDSNYLAASAATTNATLVTDRPCIVTGIQGIVDRATKCYLVFYDSAALPVPGTTAERKKIALPAGPNAAFAIDFPSGLRFEHGFGFAIVAAAAALDSSAVAANDVIGLSIDYAR